MKRINIVLLCVIVFVSFSFKVSDYVIYKHSYHVTNKFFNNPNAPVAYTGAPNASTAVVRTCATNGGCHNDAALNTAGGSVVITGIPANYIAGTTYPVTIKITHANADRVVWGFAAKTVNGTATNANWIAGSWTTTNSNTGLSGSAGATATTQTQEIRSLTAPSTAATNTYTFVNINWVAPSGATPPSTVKIYIVGNAGDGSTDETGDFIYSNVVTTNLSTAPVVLSLFNASIVNETVKLNWKTEQEINSAFFDIETSIDGVNFTKKASLPAKGNSSVVNNYSFTDLYPMQFNKSLFYRLKMVDLDGTFKYSDIKNVNIINKNIVINSITSNNTNNVLSYNINAFENKSMNIIIYNEAGESLYSYKKEILKGSNIIEIPVTAFRKNSAVVFVKFKTNDGFTKTFKQIIL